MTVKCDPTSTLPFLYLANPLREVQDRQPFDSDKMREELRERRQRDKRRNNTTDKMTKKRHVKEEGGTRKMDKEAKREEGQGKGQFGRFTSGAWLRADHWGKGRP